MTNRIAHYVLWSIFCTLIGGIFSLVAGQYYYFDTWSTSYPLQQWCSETLDIRANTESHPYWARAWLVRVLLDPVHFSYSTSSLASILQTNLFLASTQTFMMYTNPSLSPTWIDTGATILQIDRYNPSSDYIWTNGLYGTLQFVPLYSSNTYTWKFNILYNGDTVKTSLSMVGGTNIIVPSHQTPYLTGEYLVQQTPCINDTTAPTAAISTPTWGTKKSYLSWIALTLSENGWSTDVPFVRTGWLPGVGIWTGNIWSLSNQYGVNFDTFTLHVSGNGTVRYFTGGMFSPAGTLSAIADGRTWQSRDKNYTVNIDSSQLFDYGIEKQITISWNVRDRNNNLRTFSLNFNPANWPTLIAGSRTPNAWSTRISTTAPIQLGIQDEWAGVNSWSITVTLQWAWWTTYGPYIFSGNDLNLSWVTSNANQPDYSLTLSNHIPFPSSWTIQVSVYAEDMEGNIDTINDYSFTTRPSCVDLGCCNEIYVQTWYTPFIYNAFTLTISGWINPTFVVDGNTWTVDCGMENDTALSLYKWSEENTWGANYISYFDLPNLVVSGTNVKATLSGNTLTLERIYVPPITWWCIGSCGWGGGWTSSLTVDDCTLPSTFACANTDGSDNSDSYYDATCCAPIEEGHGAATWCDVSDSLYDQEITDAFSRWYNLNITNKCPIDDARLDDNITRAEAAKMISMFTIQIIGIFPDTHKIWCDEYSDIYTLSNEMKFFTKTACQLDLMGVEADGKTPQKAFSPNDFVNRAQFWTILSRLIYGDIYNIYSGEESMQWYEKHLQALYNDTIMKQIQDPFMLEKRARILLMLKRTVDNNLVEKYRLLSPAHNGAIVLLENVR